MVHLSFSHLTRATGLEVVLFKLRLIVGANLLLCMGSRLMMETLLRKRRFSFQAHVS